MAAAVRRTRSHERNRLLAYRSGSFADVISPLPRYLHSPAAASIAPEKAREAAALLAELLLDAAREAAARDPSAAPALIGPSEEEEEM